MPESPWIRGQNGLSPYPLGRAQRLVWQWPGKHTLLLVTRAVRVCTVDDARGRVYLSGSRRDERKPIKYFHGSDDLDRLLP
jgi:hypothetical protein